MKQKTESIVLLIFFLAFCITLGLFHTERDKGSLYDLTFRDNGSLDFRRLELFRPFAPLQNVKRETIDTSRMLINLIVPLASRVDTFQQFMNNFRQDSALFSKMQYNSLLNYTAMPHKGATQRYIICMFNLHSSQRNFS